ncbi:MAG: type II toxin-antitoxin system HicA family toxin [candidate division NC10 bacterium]|nr:type II toxin-antitoxin system HicA family toxin [candidate division NC10 bacterium]
MTAKLPALNTRQIIALLEQHGFQFIRQRGSHAVYRHPDGRWTTVPTHSGKTLGRGLLRKILKDADIQPET